MRDALVAAIDSMADAGRAGAAGGAVDRAVCGAADRQAGARGARSARCERLAYEATSLALQAREALLQERPGWVGLSVRMMADAPNVAIAKVTDPAGNVLFVGKGEPT